MLIWGSGGDAVEVVREAGAGHCPTCQGNQPIRILLNYRYAHIWYLFSWITSRQYVSQCARCGNGHVVEPRAIADRLGKTDPIPFMRRRGWVFGLVLVASLAGVATVFAIQRNQNLDALIAAPRVGDIYMADLSKITDGFSRSPAYGLMRLEAINGDQLAFRVAGMGYSKRSGPRKDIEILPANYYSSDIVRMPRQQVQLLYDQSVIYDIERKMPAGRGH